MLATYPTTLRTERLYLRLLDHTDDADCTTALTILRDDGGVKDSGHERLNIKSIEHYRRKAVINRPRQELCTRAPAPKDRAFLVYEGEDDSTESVGSIIMSFRSEVSFPDLGYHMKAAFTGRGYTTEASRAVLDWWTDIIGVEQIWCGMLEGNKASERIAQKLGFEFGGNFKVDFHGAAEMVTAKAYVLPGMKWPAGIIVRPSASDA